MMTNSELQTLTKTAAGFMGARNIWPNGLGFDFLGWSFKYDEATGEWQAVRPGFVVGSGGTCADARMTSIMLPIAARNAYQAACIACELLDQFQAKGGDPINVLKGK